MAVRGDEASPVNKGLLCVKGYHLPAMLYGEDRLTYPQLRRRTAGSTRISWDEALDLIAAKFGETLEAARPRRRWPCTARASGRSSTATRR